ncbi:MAG: long-chain-acyl-CoA synthetase [Bacteroidetes bacterium]|nr:long-chain-acyl-CoA synthetase [Bacteroidota bacterium]
MSISSSGKKYRLSITDIVPQFIKKLPEKIPGLLFGGIPALLIKDKDRQSIGRILEYNAIRHKNKPAIFFEDKTWTHAEFNEITNQYAHFLYKQGVRENDIVIVYLENRPEVLFSVAALAKLGAVASLINSNQRSNVLLHSINQKNDGFFIVGEELLNAFEEVKSAIQSPSKQHFFILKDHSNKSIPEGYEDMSSAVQRFSKLNVIGANQVKAGTPFAYIFTSGTTGMPKASIQTHRKWISCMYWFGMVNLNLNSKDVIYVSIPFYHSNALLIAWSSSAASGAALAVRRKFSVSEFWKDAIKYKATAFIYIGDICRYLFNAPPSKLDKAHTIKKIIGNGLRPDIWKQFKDRFNISDVYEFYASSEGNMTFTNTLNLDNTVGWCATKFEIIEYDREKAEPILDRKGFFKKVKWGNEGLMIFEISEQYPFPGYISKEENEQKVFRNVFKNGDMWYNTGDIMRNIGFLHTQFVDREGDTFRWKGENVATAEVEEVINKFPDVETCTVYGVQIPNTDGKAGMAAIQLKPKTKLNWQQFESYLLTELPHYAVPIFIRFVDKFEYTSTCKIIKKELKQESFEIENTPIWVKRNKHEHYTLLSDKIRQEIRQKGV